MGADLPADLSAVVPQSGTKAEAPAKARAAVPAGNVCAACPSIQADIALLKGRQQMVMAGQEEIKQSLHEIYSLLRASNGRVSHTDMKLAELAAQVRADTLNAAAWRSGFISLAFLALWEGAKRVFHL